MAPTLLGTHRRAKCVDCDLRWPIQSTSGSTPGTLVCFHCGVPVTLPSHDAAGDVVGVQLVEDGPDRLRGIRRGDLVAVRWDGKRRVKRVAGIPGDTIGLQGLNLCVNGRRIDDELVGEHALPFPIPWMPVDVDQNRTQSRWNAVGGWHRNEGGRWTTDSSGWLVYQHRSIHELNRESNVWDDYPYNIDVNRKLQAVDRLRLTLRAHSEELATIEVAFWTQAGSRKVALKTIGNSHHCATTTMADIADKSPVNRERPIAIRIAKGQADISAIELTRLIQYRIRPHDEASNYPITLAEDELFVVGDNIPVSIDSRDVGPLKAIQVIGRVVPQAERDENEMPHDVDTIATAD